MNDRDRQWRERGVCRAWVLAAALLVVPTVLRGAPPDAGRKHNIVCTVGMVADIARHVAGDKGEVDGIIGEGVDPHLYQVTRRDIGKLLKADLVFYVGLKLEGKMSDALENVGTKKPGAVVAVTSDLDPAGLRSPAEFGGHHDPHVWMDPLLWKQCAKTVADTLVSHDEANAAYFRSNYERYAAALDKLHVYAQDVLSTIPEQRRVIVTAHDAFGYLAARYGLTVRGIQGISTESEAGIDDINELVELLVSRRIQAVFVETSVSSKNVRSLIEGTGARGHTVVIGGNLFSDAMGAPGTYEGTYIGMIDHNVTTITRALGGTAPPQGMHGKLRQH